MQCKINIYFKVVGIQVYASELVVRCHSRRAKPPRSVAAKRHTRGVMLLNHVWRLREKGAGGGLGVWALLLDEKVFESVLDHVHQFPFRMLVMVLRRHLVLCSICWWARSCQCHLLQVCSVCLVGICRLICCGCGTGSCSSCWL